MRMVNFAQGQSAMIGAFAAYTATPVIGYVPAIGVAMLVNAGLGLVLERTAFRPFRGAPHRNSHRRRHPGLLPPGQSHLSAARIFSAWAARSLGSAILPVKPFELDAEMARQHVERVWNTTCPRPAR